MRRTIVLLLVSLVLIQTAAAAMAQGAQVAAPRGSRAVDIPPPVVQGAIRKLTGDVNAEYLKYYNTKLQDFGSRFYNAQGNVNAVQWVNDTGTGMGSIEVIYHNWTVYSTMLGRLVTATNVIYTIKGVNASSNRVYYFGAHLDSAQYEDYGNVRLKAPGADDDASGMASMIEAARILSRYKFQDTIKFAFFNGEEIGLYGSSYYLQNVSNVWHENVQAALIYDMVGTPRPFQPYDFTVESNPASAWQRTYLMDVNTRYDIGLSIASVQNTGTIPTDIMPFYNRGFQGVAAHEYDWFSNNNIHTLSDTMTHINITLERRATQLAVAALCEMARIIYVDPAIAPSDLTLDDPEPSEGKDVTVTANITNTGNVNATNLEVAFYDNGFQFASKRIWVPMNDKNTTSAVWTPTIGNHNISVVLDPKNEIQETDETNNTAYIHAGVNDRPMAVLAVTPISVLTNETVTLNGSLSSDKVGGVVSYNFTYGDGTGTGWVSTPAVKHKYTQNGNYTTSLTVRDAKGAESLKTTMLLQVLNRPPVASPHSNVTTALTQVPIKFYSEASDPDGIVTMKWNLGDGNTSTEKDPEHTYAKAGIYTVKLDVVDDDKSAVSYELRIIIDNRLPTASVLADPLTGDIQTGFTFTANASDIDGSIVSYAWDLGDGSSASTPKAIRTFAKPGNYTVRLTVKDDDGAEARALITVAVIDQAPNAFASKLTGDTLTFKLVAFRGDESTDLEGPLTYSWDFGDGNYSTEANPSHAYWRPGNYNVFLVVRDTAGQTDKATLDPLKVLNRMPKAEFRAFGNFTLNGTVYFDGTNSSDPEGPVTYEWEFGDGSVGKGAVPSHIYPRVGNYTVNLTVIDLDGAKAKATKLVTVKAPPPPPVQPKPKKPNDLSGTVNLLMILLIVLIIIIVVLTILLAMKGKRKAEPAHPEPPQPQTINAAAPTTTPPKPVEGPEYPEEKGPEAPPPGPPEKPNA